MNRRQRALACAIGIVPVSTACGFLLQCPMFVFTAWAIELTTGAGYLAWINQFQYDPAENVFRCPQGQTLRYRGKDRQGQGHIYQTAESQCRGCPVKKRCTGGSVRRIFVHWHEPARQMARELPQTPAYTRSKRERNKIETLFSELKLRMGLRRVRLRRLWNVSEQFYSAATAQNLKRLVRFLAQQAPCST